MTPLRLALVMTPLCFNGCTASNNGFGELNGTQCVGNPDGPGGIICGPQQDVWNCEQLAALGKECLQTPDGKSGWTCTQSGGTVVCNKAGTGFTGSGSWTCVSRDDVSTTCTHGPPAPPMAGKWSCKTTSSGIVCTGTPSAGSGGKGPAGFACSYAMIVFTYGGEMYVVKVPQGGTGCTNTNRTSHDRNFSYTCGGHTYDNEGYVFRRDGQAVATFGDTCSGLFAIDGRKVDAAPGVDILFAVAHNGNLPNHFGPLCPSAPADALTFPAACGD